jgi:hypothetical protein
MMEQFPGEREQSHVVATDRHQRSGLADERRIAQETAPGVVEEQIEQEAAERRGVGVQRGAVGIGADWLARQPVVHDPGHTEPVILTPRGRDFSPTAGRVGDGQPTVAEPFEHEDQILADEQSAPVSLGQRLETADHRGQLGGDAGGVAVPPVDPLQRVEERRQAHIIEQDRDQPAGRRPMLGHV